MTPDLVVASPDQLAARFAARCLTVSRQAVAARGRFTIAVPGGSVATAFLPRLAAEAIPWERTHVFWVDERAVAPDDADSNAGLLERLWRGTPALACAHRHPVPGDAPDLTLAASRYASLLEQVAGVPPSLDLVLLGVGGDGHVASLFPGRAALDERVRLVVPVTDAPKPPPRRLTITLPVIEAARVTCIAAFGAAKAPAIGAGIGASATGSPLARALRVAREAWVFVDPAAAGELSDPGAA